MQNKVLLLGSNGGVGSALLKQLLTSTYDVVCLNRNEIDLSTDSAEDKLYEVLRTLQPDTIINCCGIFGDNNIAFDKVFNVNVKANWSILNFYKSNPPQKVVKFLTIGSSSYNSGRRDYILYAATKAALFNIYQGASEYFADKNLIIGLINPGKIRTPMIQHIIKEDTICLDPEDVAQHIISFLGTLEKSSYININK